MQHRAGKYWRALFLRRAAPLAGEAPACDPGQNTVLRAVYKTAMFKVRNRVSNNAMNDLCEHVSQHGRETTYHPQTWAVTRSALQIGESEANERHCCPLCGRVWPWCPRKEWPRHRYDRCLFDGTPRFKDEGRSSKLKPERRVWLRSLRDIIQSFLRDPQIARHVGSHRDWDKDTVFWGHPYAHWLREICNGRLDAPQDGEMSMMFALGASLVIHDVSFAYSSCVSCEVLTPGCQLRTFGFVVTHVVCGAGGDGGHLFSNESKNSTVLVGLRLLDVPAEDEMKNRSWRVFCVVEGPNELPTWRFVFADLVRDFARADPSRGATGSHAEVVGLARELLFYC